MGGGTDMSYLTADNSDTSGGTDYYIDFFEDGGATIGSPVNGTVSDSSGSAIDGATVEVNQSGSTVATATTSADGSYSVDLENGTYDVTAKKSGYTQESRTVDVSGPETGVDFSLSERGVSGTVVTCPITNPECDNPSPAPEGTIVQWTGVVRNNITADAGQTKRERAQEIRDEISSWDPKSIGWDPDIQLTGTEGHFRRPGGTYPAVHSEDDWALARYAESPDLETPIIKVPANDEFVISAWDPDKDGAIQDGVAKQLHGTPVNATIRLEQLGREGDAVRTLETGTTQAYEMNARVGPWDTGINVNKHPYTSMTLPPGYYRVTVKGSDHPGYIIQAGSPDKIQRLITQDLRNEADQLTDRASELDQMTQNGTLKRGTTTTGPNGEFSVQVTDPDVKVVQVQAYTPAGKEYRLTDVQNATYQDVAQITELSDFNSSVIYGPAQQYDVGQSGVQLKAYEASSPAFGDIGSALNRSQLLDELFGNNSLGDALQDYLGRDSLNKSDLQAYQSQLRNLTQENRELRNRTLQLLAERRNQTKGNTTLSDPSNQTGNNTKLREEIATMNQAIRELRGELEADDDETTTRYEDGTAGTTIPWNGDLSADSASVVAHYPNLGYSEPVSSEYWSVSKRIGRGDVLTVSEYPVPDNAKAVTFGVTVSGEDGEDIGDEKVTAKNPSYQGPIFGLKAVSVSTLQPGPDETVSVRPVASESSPGIQNVQASVFGPDGSVPVTATSDKAEFTTNGSGIYSVEMTVTDTSGVNWTETVTVKALDQSASSPASVRARDGFTGTFAVVDNGLASGDVDSSGGTLSITGVAERGSVPDTVHFYSEDVTGSQSEHRYTVMKKTGASEPETIQKHVTTVIHTSKLNDGAVVYRNGDEPLAVGQSTAFGSISCKDTNGCSISTYTDANGQVELTVNNNPNVIQSSIHWVRMRVPADLSFTGFLAPDLSILGNSPIPLDLTFQPLTPVEGVASSVTDAVQSEVVA